MPLLESIKSRLRDGRLHRWMSRSNEADEISQWRAQGSPVPPPSTFKQQVIREAASRHGCRILVETGTLRGSTIAACLYSFDTIHSVELSEELFEAARRRFERHLNVTLWNGDSSIILPQVLAKLSTPALFWLDAHYSGDGTARANVDTPIVQELQTIARHPVAQHVILIDDARLFDGTDAYPTIEGCEALASEFWPSHQFDVQDDIIHITPPCFD